jgi:hypothetical protein
MTPRQESPWVMGANLPRRGRCGVLARREDRRAERLGAELRGFRNGDHQAIATRRDIRGELDDQLVIGMALYLEHAVTQSDDDRPFPCVGEGSRRFGEAATAFLYRPVVPRYLLNRYPEAPGAVKSSQDQHNHPNRKDQPMSVKKVTDEALVVLARRAGRALPTLAVRPP